MQFFVILKIGCEDQKYELQLEKKKIIKKRVNVWKHRIDFLNPCGLKTFKPFALMEILFIIGNNFVMKLILQTTIFKL